MLKTWYSVSKCSHYWWNGSGGLWLRVWALSRKVAFCRDVLSISILFWSLTFLNPCFLIFKKNTYLYSTLVFHHDGQLHHWSKNDRANDHGLQSVKLWAIVNLFFSFKMSPSGIFHSMCAHTHRNRGIHTYRKTHTHTHYNKVSSKLWAYVMIWFSFLLFLISENIKST